MWHRPLLRLLFSCLLLAGTACGERIEGACDYDQDCAEGQVCGSNQRCTTSSTYHPPRPSEDDGGLRIRDASGVPGTDAGEVPGVDAGEVPGADAGVIVGSDGGTGSSMRPATLAPSGNPEWTIIFDGNTWILTEFSEFMKQQDIGSCYFIGYNLNLARSEGPVSGGADGPARGHSGWSQWYGLSGYEFSPQCASDYSAELTLGSVTYSLAGTLLKAIGRSGTGSGGPSVTGTWNDGTRSGSFELYDYLR